MFEACDTTLSMQKPVSSVAFSSFTKIVFEEQFQDRATISLDQEPVALLPDPGVLTEFVRADLG